jgi:serine/threonine protein kinase
LDIAIGSAEGLRYMHSENILHGCIKPSKILLDEKLTPKLSYFEFSQLYLLDGSDMKTMDGCMGYIDPLFLRFNIFLEKNMDPISGVFTLPLKSDLYGFGAVLLELITRRKNVYNDNCSQLIMEYHKCYETEKSGRAMFDKKMTAEEDIFILEEIGKLAMECVKEDIEERPDITEVTERLVMLRRDRRLGNARNRC